MNLENTLEQVENRSIIIEIFGLGYVGFPLLVKLAMSGFNVVGIDTDKRRLELLQKDLLNDPEVHLKSEFLECKKKGNLSLSESSKKISHSKIGII